MPDPSAEERHARIAQVKQDWAQRLLANPNVVAVGIGPKIVAGEATGEPAIRVFVRSKLPPDQVPPDELIPPEIDGVTTDVAVGGEPVPVAAPVDAQGAVGVLDVRANPVKHAHAKTPPDDGSHRPLTGGHQIAPVDSNGYVGTMGCLLWDPANHDVGYALTNMHVVKPPDVPTVTTNVSKLGQPDGSDSSSRCCSDVIGVWAGGGKSADRDEALVKLAPGQKWQARIEDVGLVAGAHPLTLPEVTGVKYKVAKRGRTTKLTGGTIAALQATTGVADNLIIVDPNPNPGAAAGEIVFFDIEGDSGSALVNSANEVVGLIWARNDAGQGIAFEIGHVLGRLQATDGVIVEVASSDGRERGARRPRCDLGRPAARDGRAARRGSRGAAGVPGGERAGPAGAAVVLRSAPGRAHRAAGARRPRGRRRGPPAPRAVAPAPRGDPAAPRHRPARRARLAPRRRRRPHAARAAPAHAPRPAAAGDPLRRAAHGRRGPAAGGPGGAWVAGPPDRPGPGR